MTISYILYGASVCVYGASARVYGDNVCYGASVCVYGASVCVDGASELRYTRLCNARSSFITVPYKVSHRVTLMYRP